MSKTVDEKRIDASESKSQTYHEVVKLLGSGGFGEVYKVEKADAKGAIITPPDLLEALKKVPRPKKPEKLEDQVAAWKQKLKILNEVRVTQPFARKVAKKMFKPSEGHRPMAAEAIILDAEAKITKQFYISGDMVFDRKTPAPYFDTELIAGKPLVNLSRDYVFSDRDKILKSAIISFSEISQLMLKLVEQVARVHGKHIVHCDIKGPNILVDIGEGLPDKRRITLNLIDFGLAFRIVLKSDDEPTEEITDRLFQHPRRHSGDAAFHPKETKNRSFGKGTDIFMLVDPLLQLMGQYKPWEPRKKAGAAKRDEMFSNSADIREFPDTFPVLEEKSVKISVRDTTITFLRHMQAPEYTDRPKIEQVLRFFTTLNQLALLDQYQQEIGRDSPQRKEMETEKEGLTSKLAALANKQWQSEVVSSDKVKVVVERKQDERQKEPTLISDEDPGHFGDSYRELKLGASDQQMPTVKEEKSKGQEEGLEEHALPISSSNRDRFSSFSDRPQDLKSEEPTPQQPTPQQPNIVEGEKEGEHAPLIPQNQSESSDTSLPKTDAKPIKQPNSWQKTSGKYNAGFIVLFGIAVGGGFTTDYILNKDIHKAIDFYTQDTPEIDLPNYLAIAISAVVIMLALTAIAVYRTKSSTQTTIIDASAAERSIDVSHV